MVQISQTLADLLQFEDFQFGGFTLNFDTLTFTYQS